MSVLCSDLSKHFGITAELLQRKVKYRRHYIKSHTYLTCYILYDPYLQICCKIWSRSQVCASPNFRRLRSKRHFLFYSPGRKAIVSKLQNTHRIYTLMWTKNSVTTTEFICHSILNWLGKAGAMPNELSSPGSSKKLLDLWHINIEPPQNTCTLLLQKTRLL